MHASFVELKVKPNRFEAMKNYTDSIEEIIKVVGMKQFLVLNRGDNSCLLIVIYNSAAEQEAVAPIAAKVLGEYTQKFLSEPPERKQVEVLFNY
tara:strand:+ start:73 stop:354 length:282 start_codon:yes stop_codon:yes gene_type:complete